MQQQYELAELRLCYCSMSLQNYGCTAAVRDCKTTTAAAKLRLLQPPSQRAERQTQAQNSDGTPCAMLGQTEARHIHGKSHCIRVLHSCKSHCITPLLQKPLHNATLAKATAYGCFTLAKTRARPCWQENDSAHDGG